MDRYIGIDVRAARCMIAVVRACGKQACSPVVTCASARANTLAGQTNHPSSSPSEKCRHEWPHGEGVPQNQYPMITRPCGPCASTANSLNTAFLSVAAPKRLPDGTRPSRSPQAPWSCVLDISVPRRKGLCWRIAPSVARLPQVFVGHLNDPARRFVAFQSGLAILRHDEFCAT